MKRKSNLGIFITCIVLFVCEIIFYITDREIENLILAIICFVFAVGHIVIQFFVFKTKTFVITKQNVYYKFGENIIKNATVLKEKQIKSEKIKQLFGVETAKVCRFENKVGLLKFELIQGVNDNTLLIITDEVEKTKNFQEIRDVSKKDKKKNFDYLLQFATVKPLEKDDNMLDVKYSKDSLNCVAVYKTENGFVLSPCCYVLQNRFSKEKHITLEIFDWSIFYAEDKEDLSALEDKLFSSFEEAEKGAMEYLEKMTFFCDTFYLYSF